MRRLIGKAAAGAAAALLAGACGNSSSKNAPCKNGCPTEGATQCSGIEVQACLAGSDGCLDWTATKTCAGGETCDPATVACEDVCSASNVAAACTTAFKKFVGCCAGGNVTSISSATDLCHFGISEGQDPLVYCEGASNATCAAFNRAPAKGSLAGNCCCPSGEFCDPDHGYACVPTCAVHADCITSPNGTACAPVVQNDQPAAKVYICKPDDGAAWHGCNSSSVICQGTSECFADASSNRFCTLACTFDSECGPSAIGCCNLTQSEDGSAGDGCGVCQ